MYRSGKLNNLLGLLKFTFSTSYFSDYAKVGGVFVFGEVAMYGAYEGDVPNEHRYGLASSYLE